ncbi:hypothetical protein MGA3_06960 [Bacillus methanolicus MGA3]|nr:hypothetical protein MGA3_06960 [Bacillus methanolicus MGA3]
MASKVIDYISISKKKDYYSIKQSKQRLFYMEVQEYVAAASNNIKKEGGIT